MFIVDQKGQRHEWDQDNSKDSIPPVMAMAPPRKGSQGYWALTLLVAGLVALLVVGYLALGSISREDPFTSFEKASKWVQDLKGKSDTLIRELKRDLLGVRDPVQDAKEYLGRGYKSYTKNQLDQAIVEFNEAIRLDPNNPVAYYWRGRAYAKAEQYNQALSDFQRAIALRPDYPEAHDNLGWIYAKGNQDDKAIQHLSRSIELKPENGWVYYQRSRLLLKRGDREAALTDAKKGCELGFSPACALYKEQDTAKP